MPNISVRLAYFHPNRLLTGLYKQETEILWRKDDGNIKKQTDIDRHGPEPSLNSSQPPDPPHFPLPTTFKTAKSYASVPLCDWFLFWMTGSQNYVRNMRTRSTAQINKSASWFCVFCKLVSAEGRGGGRTGHSYKTSKGEGFAAVVTEVPKELGQQPSLSRYLFTVMFFMHRLNMELDLQSLFGLLLTAVLIG